MSPVLWLRTTACMTALLALGHLLGNPWTPVPNAEGQRLIDAMRSYHFDAMGFNRSYLDFYEGFGWMLGVYLLGHAVLFWQLAGLAKVAQANLRPLVTVLCIEYCLVAVVGGNFLFWIPLGISAAITALLVLSWVSLRASGLSVP
jgi:uncharacterized protein YjeT (DUF2065 family)